MCKCSPEDVHNYGPCDDSCNSLDGAYGDDARDRRHWRAAVAEAAEMVGVSVKDAERLVSLYEGARARMAV